MSNVTPVGLDTGNTNVNITIQGKSVAIPNRVAFERPAGPISDKTGMELKPVTFPLLFTQGAQTVKRWFDRDTLAGPAIQKLDMAKYQSENISVLFSAALYKWSKTYKVDLATLGKLNVVASMPPGLFQNPAKNKAARAAFGKAFNRGQSHLKIRDGQMSRQVVTQFGDLVREAVTFGAGVPRNGALILTVDLGGGTNDYALFNGSDHPLNTWTDQAGLLHAYSKIDPVNPAAAELKVLRNKKTLPHQLTVFYNEVERRIQLMTLKLPLPISVIYIIGGGAALMTPAIKAMFAPLAPKVIIKNEHATAYANWIAAGGK